MKEFFSHVPGDSGLAYVVVVHLSPEHKSVLADVLQPHVKIPVTQVQNHVFIEKDHVYVIPPNANLNTIDTHLRLSDLEEKRSQRAPIDHFFRTLAVTHGKDAAGIILTGTGSDGSLGMKDIKEKGGITLVQDPEEAEYDGMPQSAISTGLVDKVLRLGELPTYLMSYFGTTPILKTLETGRADSKENKLLNKVLAKVKARTGRDFSQYKSSTLLRRMQRRMQMYRVEKLEDYLKILDKEGGEAIRLSDDFLINVTSFFRDPEVFDYLKSKIIPQILHSKKEDEPLRVWSIGCATGEEAYSAAMVLDEVSSSHGKTHPKQIFASDLHEDSLKMAREGFYPGDINVDVSEDRLKKFFQKENGGYRIRKEIREMVVFTPHNLLSDPPFSKLDLVICRNLLIYLKSDIQKDILELLHYSLLPAGYLLLGAAERIKNTDLFALQDKDQTLYIKRNVVSPEPKLPVFSSSLAQYDRHNNQEADDSESPRTKGQIHQQVLEHYGPPSLLLNQDYEVLHLSETAGRYLKIPGGEISKDIYQLLPDALHSDLRTTVFSAEGKKEIVRSKPRPVSIEGKDIQLVLAVRSVQDQDRQPLILVMFEEFDLPEVMVERSPEDVRKEENGRKLKILEDELKETREKLQSIIEEYETSREEMKASNEELQSSNEELRSTLEELETSKEELQSLNEELITMNQENRHKVEELNLMSDDLQNFMGATEIASVFLDKDMRIMRYTPKLEELFNVRPIDKGRPISDQTHCLDYSELEKDARKTLRTLHVTEREVKDNDGNTYLSRILPYRSAEDKINGVVATFIDITARKRAEEKLRKSEERLKTIVNAGFDMVFRMNHDWSEMLELEGRGFLSDTTGPLSDWMQKYIPQDEEERISGAIKKAVEGKSKFELEHKIIRKDGTPGWFRSRAIPIIDQKGSIVEWMGAAIDETKEKENEEELKASKEFSEYIIETLHEPLLLLTPDLEVQSANAAFYNDFLVRPEETVGKKVYDLGNGQWNIPSLRRLLEEILPRDKHFVDYEVEHNFDTIGRKTMLLNARKLDHRLSILLGIRDITLKKEYESHLQNSERRLKQMVNIEGIGVLTYNANGTLIDANESFLKMSGYNRNEIESGRLNWKKLTPEDHWESSRSHLDILARTGKIGPYEKEYMFRDGSRTWMLVAGADIGEGRYIEYCMDISDRKRAERELEESQRRMQFTLESVHMGSWEIMEGSEEFTCDEGFLKLFRLPLDSGVLTLDDVYSAIDPADEKRVKEEVSEAWKGNGDLETDFRIRIDGEVKWIAVRGKILQDNNTRRMIGVNYDVTKSKRTEEALDKARVEAENAARAKEDFLAHMSHEIRTPLNVVIGLTHLLLEQDPKGGQMENLKTLKIASENLGTTINDILDYSKLKAGKISLEKESFSMGILMKDILSLHELNAGQKKIKLEWRMDERINDFIHADRLKISQVLHNLLSNALKFTNKGKVSLDLDLESEKGDKQYIRFSVTDTGIGISPDQREEIFNVFSQGDSSTKRQYGGTGLGLTISRLYLQMMGSDIQLESEPGKGSRFWFILPVGKGIKVDLKEEEKPADDLSDMKMLVVEDDQYNLLMIGQLLEQWGVVFDTAENGMQAIELARKNPYDVILMDIRMPEMDGFTASQEIRKAEGCEKVAIIALTADLSEMVHKEIDSGLLSGVSIKPVDPTVLKGMLLRFKKG